MTEHIYEAVRTSYANAARRVTESLDRDAACCGDGCGCGAAASTDTSWGSGLYADTDRSKLPDAAVLASLGCGNPIAVAELKPGEMVLDLGSGGGIDVLLSARRVGPTGKAYGLDMTEEMLALARRNAADAGATNVDFLKGYIEAIPLPAESVDVVISNCVINLAADKSAVFSEMARVLRPGGRVGISDVVADDALTPDERAERGSFIGCIAGALTFSEYRAGLEAAGFRSIELTPTHAVADGMQSAIVKAVRGDNAATSVTAAAPGLQTVRALPVTAAGCCP